MQTNHLAYDISVCRGWNVTEYGIIAYLRSIAGRCEHLAMKSRDDQVRDELRALSADLMKRAAVVETTFRAEKRR